MPGVSGVTVVTMLVWLFFFAHQAAGASSARHSLRPLLEGQDVSGKPRAKNTRRDRGRVFCRHCEEQSDEAIHTSLADPRIASWSLSSGAHSRDPLARNDGGFNHTQTRNHRDRSPGTDPFRPSN